MTYLPILKVFYCLKFVFLDISTTLNSEANEQKDCA